ncbi:FAD-dependent oxidoreductase [Kutzneria kofuensis]|uniref:2-polyprenyl-6-methoxyphenol hydroxylase-like FAD-dependent oxidoreductase n=1 Tax=Kutzneria kofuensis TaxID=103725 RepID=A0A7W9KKC3_9PSEU|nr:FAD-dependent oxidoreductase [Kutzneria kofuensis]MBB5894025.1 2-polyprenyl-6-methoxyphenol hydroxylase-like FAD-dependent oxidoreductase [Kutzneria kofuensis]
MERTTCCVVGGGPAGMVLGLLLARAGVDVTVLEKHGDFLRDFRGDTVHASTLRLLDELGLTERFAKVPHQLVKRLGFPVGPRTTAVVDLAGLPGPHKHIAMVPQWDFLDMIADAAAEEPSFHLRMNTEATGLTTKDGRVTGITYRTRDGETGEIAADLTVACDGRRSVLRSALGLGIRSWRVPMDCWWLRVPRHEGDPSGLGGMIGSKRMVVYIDRGDYFQLAFLIEKGSDARWREAGLQSFRDSLAELVPWLADRVDSIESLDDAKLLDVKLDRLTTWYSDGLLCIGDAAHAMSPVGGVGINLAVQDAVAAARILAGPLRRGTVTTADLAKVQRRRGPATTVTQGMQRLMHDNAVGPALSGRIDLSKRTPLALRLLNRFPKLGLIPAYLVAIGFRPEHAPEFARR